MCGYNTDGLTASVGALRRSFKQDNMMRHLLLVDDEINVLHALRRGLSSSFQGESFRIETFDDPQQALERVKEADFDVIISDYRMPVMTGVVFLKQVKEIQPDAVRLILSASTDFEAVKTAINDAAVFRFLTKPWEQLELNNIIQLAFTQRDQLLEERRLADESRMLRGEMTPEEVEARRLEEAEPGITKVNWGPGGSVLLEDL